MIKLAPSILSADFSRMGEAVSELKGWGADWVHLDVMDGHFVPNLTFGPAMVKSIRNRTDLPFDVHLMVSEPQKWIEPFHDAGADSITFHVEAETHIHRTLQKIHSLNMRAGVVLNPATSLSTCEYILEDCDLVLLMSVNPGFGGQRFIPSVLKRIALLREMMEKRNLRCEIEIDGGINPETARQCASAGATVLVAGNSVFTAASPKEMVETLKQA